MISIKEYKKADSLEEAWQLNQKRANRIIGGMMWIKMGSGSVQTAIDLSGLGLDTIEEDEEQFRIGSMVTLRQMETHRGLNEYTQGAVKEALCHIVGVQFRNSATLGGSLFGRYGFSDVLTLFMALETKVELYRGGIVSLEEFAGMPYDRDILVRIIVKKVPAACFYQSVRNTDTDFPVLTCCSALREGELRISVGARPGKAMLLKPLLPEETGLLRPPFTEEKGKELGMLAAERIPMDSNMRGSAGYRKKLVQTLVTRAAARFAEPEEVKNEGKRGESWEKHPVSGEETARSV